jgi:tRNA-dihydrouridine synthase
MRTALASSLVRTPQRRQSTLNAAPSLTLGSLQLQSDVVLAPLERVSDVGFRRLCFAQGAGITWTEMVYASYLKPTVAAPTTSALKTAADYIDTHDPATLTGVQLLVDRTAARDDYGVKTLRKALRALEAGVASGTRPEWANIRAVDLNFGCPAPSLAKRGCGPAQLRRRSKVRRLFEVLAAWKQETPLAIGAVGAKVRLGANAREQGYQVYLPVAEAAAEVGLDYLAVHARHAEQRSRDPPTWAALAEVAALVGRRGGNGGGGRLAVIGNGDVRTAADAARMREETRCDGVMVGRAAMHNPWSLRQLCGGDGGGDGDGGSGGEWPTVTELERSIAEYEEWASARPAAGRYRAFHEENFARLRREVGAGAVCVGARLGGDDTTAAATKMTDDWG